MWDAEIASFVGYLRAAGRSAETIRLRRYYIGRLAREIERDTPWAIKLDDLLDWLGGSEWSPETRKAARASVSVFFEWAEATDRISPRRNPARRLPTISVPPGVPRPAPDDRLRQALWLATDRDRLFLMLAAYAGLRRAEIAAVHAGDIDWQRDRLLVRGKGGRERWVPLHPDLRSELEAELTRRRLGSHGTGYRYGAHIRRDGPGGWLFPGKRGHVTPDVPGRTLSRIMGGQWTAHTLRHRFATEAYAADRDLRAVQELLGHSKPETTAGYVQAPDGAKRAAVARVGVGI